MFGFTFENFRTFSSLFIEFTAQVIGREIVNVNVFSVNNKS